MRSLGLSTSPVSLSVTTHSICSRSRPEFMQVGAFLSWFGGV